MVALSTMGAVDAVSCPLFDKPLIKVKFTNREYLVWCCPKLQKCGMFLPPPFAQFMLPVVYVTVLSRECIKKKKKKTANSPRH